MNKYFKLFAGCSLGFASVGLISVPAQAVTATTTFQVTATVLKACIVTATPLAFGNYDPTATVALDSASALTVLCTVGTPFTVGLSAGLAPSATVTTRGMINGSDKLSYALYSDSNRSVNWGNTVGAGADTPASVTAPILPTVIPVYGRVAPGQNVPANLYTDTVTVTVNY